MNSFELGCCTGFIWTLVMAWAVAGMNDLTHKTLETKPNKLL